MKNYSLRFTIGIVLVLIALVFAKIQANNSKKQNNILESKINYLEKALKQTPTLIFVKNKDLELIDFNDFYVKYVLNPMGFEKEDAINKDDYAIWDSATANKYRAIDSLTIICDCPIPQDVTVPFNNDSIRFVGVKYPYYFEDGTVGSAGEFKVLINEK